MARPVVSSAVSVDDCRIVEGELDTLNEEIMD